MELFLSEDNILLIGCSGAEKLFSVACRCPLWWLRDVSLRWPFKLGMAFLLLIISKQIHLHGSGAPPFLSHSVETAFWSKTVSWFKASMIFLLILEVFFQGLQPREQFLLAPSRLLLSVSRKKEGNWPSISSNFRNRRYCFATQSWHLVSFINLPTLRHFP